MTDETELICPACKEPIGHHDHADCQACLNVLARNHNRYICTNCDVGLPAKYKHCPGCGYPGGVGSRAGVA